MKRMTVLEERLKRAHTIRRNAFKRNKIYPVLPELVQSPGQYAPVRIHGKLSKFLLDEPVKSIARQQASLTKHITTGRLLLALALTAITLIILCSG
jgi:hypothetical protein